MGKAISSNEWCKEKCLVDWRSYVDNGYHVTIGLMFYRYIHKPSQTVCIYIYIYMYNIYIYIYYLMMFFYCTCISCLSI